MGCFLKIFLLPRAERDVPSTSNMWGHSCYEASLVAETIKTLLAMQETTVQSLGQEDPLEKGMATYSSILAWESPWTEEPGGLQSSGWQRAGHNWVTNCFTFMLSETSIWGKNMRDELWFLRFGNVLWRTEFSFFIRLNKKLSRTSSVIHFCSSLDSCRFVSYSWLAWKGLNWGVTCFLGEDLLLRIYCQKLTVKLFLEH